ncbi:MAG: hypothetical protein Ct9H300mP20_06620 [Gammaproteobacteria bacterium]|nr:MAG: hypothetical protein Ct9H300mP20_06620 [Gammaproteobacteria bacterium]
MQKLTKALLWFGDSLRELVLSQGMRNSNVMAIAPTATIANITGVSQSIEPTYQNLYVKSNFSVNFTVPIYFWSMLSKKKVYGIPSWKMILSTTMEALKNIQSPRAN